MNLEEFTKTQTYVDAIKHLREFPPLVKSMKVTIEVETGDDKVVSVPISTMVNSPRRIEEMLALFETIQIESLAAWRADVIHEYHARLRAVTQEEQVLAKARSLLWKDE